MLKAAIGFFEKGEMQERVVTVLRQNGVAEDQLAVLVSAEAGEVGNLLIDDAAEGATVGAATGGGVGAVAGLLGAVALLPVPGVNVAAMSAAVGGIGGGFLGALFGARAKDGTEISLKDHLAQGGTLVVAKVSEANEASVLATLKEHGGQFVSTQEISATELDAIQDHHAVGETAVPKPGRTHEHYNPQKEA